MLTQEYLKSIVRYDPDTGEFFRLVQCGPRGNPGKVIGNPDENGYPRMQIGGKKYRFHQLAWLYVFGGLPALKIDHLNADVSDNRISNLRLLTHAQNHQNRRRANRGTRVGLLGVDHRKGKYRARITRDGEQVHIGDFETAEAAHAAYVQAKRKIHPFGTL